MRGDKPWRVFWRWRASQRGAVGKAALTARETGILRGLVLAVTATLALMALPEVLPPRTLDLLSPDFPGYVHLGYWDGEYSADEVDWLQPGRHGFFCHRAKRPGYQGCAITFKFGPRDVSWTHGMDLRQFKAIELDLGYQGPANDLRITLRDFDPRFSVPTDGNSPRPHNIFLHGDDRARLLVVSMDQLTVPDWWVSQRNLPLTSLRPGFENVVTLVVDVPPDNAGVAQTMALRRLRLTGDWVSREVLYRGILLAWLTVALALALRSFLALRRERRRIHELSLQSVQLRRRQQVLEDQAMRDALTGLLNRRGLRQALDTRVDAVGRWAVILLDIDHFKHINDEHGHAVGDRTLAALGRVLREKLRRDDLVARWGGEEFVVLCRAPDLTVAARMAELLRLGIADAPLGDGAVARITVSAGVALADGATLDEAGLAEVMERADQALYRAKAGGRNRVSVDPTSLPKAADR